MRARWTDRRWSRWTAIGLSALISGCVTTQAGTSASAPGAGTFSAPPPAAGTGQGRAPAQKGVKDEPRFDQPVVIKPRRKDAVIVASQELDSQCETIVAPFDLGTSTVELLSLAVRNAGTQIAEKIAPSRGRGTDLTDDRQRAKAQADVRHKVGYSVREAAARMNWLPMDAELAYGQTLHERLQDKLLPRDSRQGKVLYPRADLLLAETLQGVDQPHEYVFQVHIRTDSGENAMSLPGGIIHIDKALVADADKAAKAKFAMAHEIAHILQRHETRNAQARIIDAASLRGGYQDMVETIRTIDQKGSTAIALALAGKLQFERHFGAQELQADACAVRLLNNTLPTRQALLEAVASFVRGLPPATEDDKPAAKPAAGRQTPTVDDVVGLVTRPIDRHPNSAERVKRLKRMLEVVREAPQR